MCVGKNMRTRLASSRANALCLKHDAIIEFLCVRDLCRLSMVCKTLVDVYTVDRVYAIKETSNVHHPGEYVHAMDSCLKIYTGKILAVKRNKIAHVSFENFSPRWDEWLTAERMREIVTKRRIRLCGCTHFTPTSSATSKWHHDSKPNKRRKVKFEGKGTRWVGVIKSLVEKKFDNFYAFH